MCQRFGRRNARRWATAHRHDSADPRAWVRGSAARSSQVEAGVCPLPLRCWRGRTEEESAFADPSGGRLTWTLRSKWSGVGWVTPGSRVRTVVLSAGDLAVVPIRAQITCHFWIVVDNHGPRSASVSPGQTPNLWSDLHECSRRNSAWHAEGQGFESPQLHQDHCRSDGVSGPVWPPRREFTAGRVPLRALAVSETPTCLCLFGAHVPDEHKRSATPKLALNPPGMDLARQTDILSRLGTISSPTVHEARVRRGRAGQTAAGIAP